MQTPDNEAGRETEAIMQAIAPWGTKHSTERYNRAYEAIYALLCEIADGDNSMQRAPQTGSEEKLAGQTGSESGSEKA